MKTMALRARNVLVLCVLTACSGGDWQDSPPSCQRIAFAARQLSHELIRGSDHIMTIEEGKQLNATESLEESVQFQFDMHAKGSRLSADAQTKLRAGFDEVVQRWADRACREHGGSYAGRWECSKKHQRFLCK